MLKNNSAGLATPDTTSHYGASMYAVEEIRPAKLLNAITRRGHGGQAQIGREMGVSPAQIQ